MGLELLNSSGRRRLNPRESTIRAEVGGLTAERHFLVLAAGDNVYLQVAVNPQGSDAPYVLEYRDGGPEDHYSAGVHDLDAIERALVAYARGDGSWRSGHAWARLVL